MEDFIKFPEFSSNDFYYWILLSHRKVLNNRIQFMIELRWKSIAVLEQTSRRLKRPISMKSRPWWFHQYLVLNVRALHTLMSSTYSRQSNMISFTLIKLIEDDLAVHNQIVFRIFRFKVIINLKLINRTKTRVSRS